MAASISHFFSWQKQAQAPVLPQVKWGATLWCGRQEGAGLVFVERMFQAVEGVTHTQMNVGSCRVTEAEFWPPSQGADGNSSQTPVGGAGWTLSLHL